MTGGEIAAGAIAGKIVNAAGADARAHRKLERQALLESAKENPRFAKAVDNYAKRVALKEAAKTAAVTKLFQPIASLLGISKVYFENDFGEDMAEKLEAVPEENRVAPKPSLAAPAMQGLAFSLDEPDLKEMYLALLANAADDRVRDTVHPSFVEVIKQLTAFEAELLESILLRPSAKPIISLDWVSGDDECGRTKGHSRAVFASHIFDFRDAQGTPTHLPHGATYVDNWIRLGLVEVRYGQTLVLEGSYDWADNRPELLDARATPQEDGSTAEFTKGVMRSTNFGRQFGNAVGILA